MALSAEEKHQIKQAYEREWKNYRARIRKAEKQGYVIPDRLNLKKVKNPQSWKTVDKLKSITLREIRNEIRFEGGQLYVDKYGKMTSKEEAATELDIQPKPILNLLRRKRSVFETDPNRPLSFDEYRRLSEDVAKIRANFDLQDPRSKEAYQDVVLGRISKERGKGFDESTFLFNEERKNGYLARDANRPLDEQEINYIKTKLEHEDVDIDDPFMYQKAIDDLRSAYPNYDTEIQMHQEETQENPAYAEILNENGQTYEEEMAEKEWAYEKLRQQNEIPQQAENRQNTYSSQTQETYAFNALYSMVSELMFGSKFAERNRAFLLNELRRLKEQYDARPLNNAVKAIAGENGELFDVELLYKTGELAQWLFKLERLVIELSAKEGEDTTEQKDEAEANLSEALENADELDID